ncbi:RES family NAD+ phosphorylase [Pseudomonas cichorii]|nr:RES family NAD+ phosphorylase [Pseudomonas cichorii]MBX8512295.1 RES family NAD+ phosphorylase [Pseudomonas cichorii]MBX8527276.1 RES family NAD+ phosphorylase [Pseudomonas cichorii]MBX8534026.1 RES family NAD+ phosphorylase [Pseudomonas cichorii]MBX8539263.1 RES family NAD+ phosphorylase [Pseudomonas cichorii]MBX8552815.1 RES family NAD+ phosphorylase [Pseudomonas cichorii]
MIHVYRLVKRKWLAQAFDGEGAKLYGGRWNSKGQACVYCAGSESLALLEVLVHMDNSSMIQHYVMLELLIPKDRILKVRPDTLPADWREEPAPASTSSFGDAWLESGQSLALAVPSVIVPREFNYLLNVRHSSFKTIVAKAMELDFEVDSRLA